MCSPVLRGTSVVRSDKTDNDDLVEWFADAFLPVTTSLTREDRQQKAKRKVKSGQEIGATGKVFVFFSNRLGCAGSLLVTAVLSALLFLLMRGCNGPPNAF